MSLYTNSTLYLSVDKAEISILRRASYENYCLSLLLKYTHRLHGLVRYARSCRPEAPPPPKGRGVLDIYRTRGGRGGQSGSAMGPRHRKRAPGASHQYGRAKTLLVFCAYSISVTVSLASGNIRNEEPKNMRNAVKDTMERWNARKPFSGFRTDGRRNATEEAEGRTYHQDRSPERDDR